MQTTQTLTVNPVVIRNCRFQSIERLPIMRRIWNRTDVLVFPGMEDRRLILGMAASDRALAAVFRLRHQVFGQELGHGTLEERESGIDRDVFDEQMHHLILIDRDSKAVVGTYRVQTVRQGLKHHGIYASQEFDLTALKPYFPQLVECGRACILPAYRKATSLFTLWSGLVQYVEMTGSRWLFGCCGRC